MVLRTVRKVAGAALQGREPGEGAEWPSGIEADHELVRAVLDRIVVRQGSVEVHLVAEEASANPTVIPWSRPPHTRKRQVIAPAGVDTRPLRPMRPEARAKLLDAIARARSWVRELTSGEMTSTAAIAEREGVSERSIRTTLSLAFLSPNIVDAIIAGNLPRGTGLTTFTDLPHAWTEQQRHVGLQRV